ncbi:hypothetical protein NECAME_03423 [Necator americanus]|uniref:Uncharacterized protein n=1 Tax=Necator americanus TaxID=51031 RepID=W2T687_NECAM|nr:hypothetical protein NECAME_03423 [Necator americanus]ETN76492.1 hypothetical protein NECAME_03423 [Necator americanus]
MDDGGAVDGKVYFLAIRVLEKKSLTKCYHQKHNEMFYNDTVNQKPPTTFAVFSAPCSELAK